jgi:hypothetical protein
MTLPKIKVMCSKWSKKCNFCRVWKISKRSRCIYVSLSCAVRNEPYKLYLTSDISVILHATKVLCLDNRNSNNPSHLNIHASKQFCLHKSSIKFRDRENSGSETNFNFSSTRLARYKCSFAFLHMSEKNK